MISAAVEPVIVQWSWFCTVAERPRVAGPLTLDVSRLDHGDELVDEDTGARLDAIRAVMRPGKSRHGATFNRRKALDVHHVSTCAYAGLDALVTTDKRHILGKKEQLADLGVVVLDPDEAVALVAARRNGLTTTA